MTKIHLNYDSNMMENIEKYVNISMVMLIYKKKRVV